MKFSSFVLSAVTFIAFHANLATADCCSPTKRCLPRGGCSECGDGTAATPCCGYGPCNIFCCNCDYGCRPGFNVKEGPGRYSHAYDEWTANPLSEAGQIKECANKMRESDANSDGLLTFFEYVKMNPMMTKEQALEHWAKFDWEGKGYMTFDEAYERKAA